MKRIEKWNQLLAYKPEPSERFLTVYLNTASNTGPKPEWTLHLKNGFKRLIEYAKAGEDEHSLKLLEQLQAKVEKEAENNRTDMKRGLFAVAGSSGKLFIFEKIQASLPNSFYWESEPMLDEMKEIISRYPAAGIIQVGADSVTVMDTVLGEINQQYQFEWDVQTENWREYIDNAGSDRTSTGSTRRERFELRMDVNRQRWMQRLVPVIERFCRQKKWGEMIFTGEKALATELCNQFTFKNKRVISKNLKGAPPHEVLSEIYAVMNT